MIDSVGIMIYGTTYGYHDHDLWDNLNGRHRLGRKKNTYPFFKKNKDVAISYYHRVFQTTPFGSLGMPIFGRFAQFLGESTAWEAPASASRVC
jgi:hypothetical protein